MRGEVTVAAKEATSKPGCARNGKGFLGEMDSDVYFILLR